MTLESILACSFHVSRVMIFIPVTFGSSLVTSDARFLISVFCSFNGRQLSSIVDFPIDTYHYPMRRRERVQLSLQGR